MKLFLVPGSKRAASWNLKLLNVAARYLSAQGHQVDLFDFKHADVPVFDDDLLKAGIPRDVQDFKDRVTAADGVLIATPEYNYSVPGALKNLIDWASRPPATNAFKGKLVAHTGATTGNLGTLQAQSHLHHVLSIGVSAHVLSGLAFTVSKADQAFDEQGVMKDPAQQQKFETFLSHFVTEVGHRKAAP